MTPTIELLDRVGRLESREDGLRSVFRETIGHMHDAMAADRATGTVLSAIRITQLEHDQRLREHSEMLHEHGFLLKGLTEGQKRLDGRMDKLDGRMDKLDGRVDKLDSRMGRLEGRMERLERLIKRGFGMSGIKLDNDED